MSLSTCDSIGDIVSLSARYLNVEDQKQLRLVNKELLATVQKIQIGPYDSKAAFIFSTTHLTKTKDPNHPVKVSPRFRDNLTTNVSWKVYQDASNHFTTASTILYKMRDFHSVLEYPELYDIEPSEDPSKNGRIYSPAKSHRLIANMAFILGQVHAGRPVMIISELSPKNVFRLEFPSTHSALTEEIAALTKSGYVAKRQPKKIESAEDSGNETGFVDLDPNCPYTVTLKAGKEVIKRDVPLERRKLKLSDMFTTREEKDKAVEIVNHVKYLPILIKAINFHLLTALANGIQNPKTMKEFNDGGFLPTILNKIKSKPAEFDELEIPEFMLEKLIPFFTEKSDKCMLVGDYLSFINQINPTLLDENLPPIDISPLIKLDLNKRDPDAKEYVLEAIDSCYKNFIAHLPERAKPSFKK